MKSDEVDQARNSVKNLGLRKIDCQPKRLPPVTVDSPTVQSSVPFGKIFLQKVEQKSPLLWAVPGKIANCCSGFSSRAINNRFDSKQVESFFRKRTNTEDRRQFA